MITSWATVAVSLVLSGVPGHSRYQVINMMDVSFHQPMSCANGICHCCLEGNLSMKAGYGLSSRRFDQAECACPLQTLVSCITLLN